MNKELLEGLIKAQTTEMSDIERIALILGKNVDELTKEEVRNYLMPINRKKKTIAYDFSNCLCSIDTNTLTEMVDKVEQYKSNLVKNVSVTGIRTKSKDIEKVCKENNIYYNYDVYTNTVIVEYTMDLELISEDQNINTMEEWEVIELFSDEIAEENSNIEEIINNYENFEIEEF